MVNTRSVRLGSWGGGLESCVRGGGGGWHEAMVLFAYPIGLSPLYIPTLCGSERALVVSSVGSKHCSEPLVLGFLGGPGNGAAAPVEHRGSNL